MIKEQHYINTLYYQIEQTAKYCRYLGSQVFNKLNLGINVEEFVTLDTLSLHGEICQRDLAKLILKDRPATGRILNSLEEKELIERFADTKNNRLVRKIIMTNNGKKTLKQITGILKKYLEKIPHEFSQSKIEEIKNNMREFREILEKEVEMNI
ncbi:MarR family transcriptional regulator [bacterium]|nr:MarR family transcriptional regulator [bacterium]